jgi:4-hydroxy-tetrahydrodipicolinate reductase
MWLHEMTPPERGSKVPVVVMGLGVIGREVALAALSCDEVDFLGAVDSNPTFEKRKLSELLGVETAPGVVRASLEDLGRIPKGSVLLHCTGSSLSEVSSQLLEAIAAKMNVVSTCEELSFPFLKYPELADRLDRAAMKNHVSVLGTGVNPGFVLDRLVATLGQVCGVVRRVKASRVVDARTRREALQRKIGAGLSEEEFMNRVDAHSVGHVGLIESCALASLGVGMNCDDFEEEIVPVIAEEDIEGGAFLVKRGQVAGMSQTAVGFEEGQERIRLDLTIAVGAEDVGDRIEIDSDLKLKMEIAGGIAGDRATANVVVNAAARVSAAEAGLLTVLELPAGR